METVFLTEDKKSFIIIHKNFYPSSEKLIRRVNRDMPETYHEIKMAGKMVAIPRLQ